MRTMITCLALATLAAAGPEASAQTHLWSYSFGEQGGNVFANWGSADADGNVFVAGSFRGTVDFGGGPFVAPGDEDGDVDIYLAKFDAAGNHLWSRQFGGAEGEHVRGAATDEAGNTVMAGDFYGTLDFGDGALVSAGSADIFIAKLDPSGEPVWSRRFGDAEYQSSAGVATDASGNVIVGGSFRGTLDLGGGPLESAGFSDIFIAKFNAAGDHVWSYRYGTAGGSESARVAGIDGSGNVLVTAGGYSLDLGGGPVRCDHNKFVAKFDTAGNNIWTRCFGVRSLDAEFDESGNIVLAGEHSDTVDFGGGPLASTGFFDVFVAKLDPAGRHLWSRSFGDSTWQFFNGLAVDPSGGVTVTGRFEGTVDFGGGPLVSDGGRDAFIVKLDPAGNHLWGRRFDSANTSLGRPQIGEAGNIILTGGRFGDPPEEGDSAGFIAKLTGAGDLLWSRDFVAPARGDGRAWDIAMQDDQGAVVSGRLSGTVDFGGGPLVSGGSATFFTAKFDAAGKHVWSHGYDTFSSGSFHPVNRIATDGQNLIMVGGFAQTLDLGGAPLVSAGRGDAYVAKFDASGHHLWSRRFGDAESQGATNVATDAAGNIIVVGWFQGTVDLGGGPLVSASESGDVFIAKLDPSGDHLWSRRFGDWRQYTTGVAADPSGNVLVVGVFTGTLDFGGEPLVSAGDIQQDIFIAKFDPSGDHVWSRRFGAARRENVFALAVDAADNVSIVGVFRDTIDFGGGPLVNDGRSEMFIAGLDGAGRHRWSRRFGGSYFNASIITTDPSGHVIVAGTFRSTTDFGGGPLVSAGTSDIFVAKFDPAGNHIWSRRFGDPQMQTNYGVAADAGENVLLTGSIQGTVDFGGGPLPHGGPYSLPFIAKFSGDSSTPVLLEALDSRWVEDHVEVTWRLYQVEGELDFVIFRAPPGGGYERMAAPVIRREQGAFVYEDRSAAPGIEYRYRVDVLEDGKSVASFESSVTTPAARFALHQNHPNPFNPATRIRYEVPAPGGEVRLAIYDVSGRLVRTLVAEGRPPGMHTVTWDARDAGGVAVSSGVYFYRMTMEGIGWARRMTLMK